jgi:hypothetical protein
VSAIRQEFSFWPVGHWKFPSIGVHVLICMAFNLTWHGMKIAYKNQAITQYTLHSYTFFVQFGFFFFFFCLLLLLLSLCTVAVCEENSVYFSKNENKGKPTQRLLLICYTLILGLFHRKPFLLSFSLNGANQPLRIALMRDSITRWDCS